MLTRHHFDAILGQSITYTEIKKMNFNINTDASAFDLYEHISFLDSDPSTYISDEDFWDVSEEMRPHIY